VVSVTCFFQGPKWDSLFEALREKLTGGEPDASEIMFLARELGKLQSRHEIGEAMNKPAREYLAVGGPLDGKLVGLPEELEEVVIPHVRETDGVLDDETFRYKKIHFGREIVVLIPAGEDSPFCPRVFEGEHDRVLRHLIQNYRPSVIPGAPFVPFPAEWKPTIK
jgi:hypothetical protein